MESEPDYKSNLYIDNATITYTKDTVDCQEQFKTPTCVFGTPAVTLPTSLTQPSVIVVPEFT